MKIKFFALGLFVGFAVIAIAGYTFIVTGGMPVPTKSKPLPFEEEIAEMSIGIATKEAASLTAPLEATERHLLEGVKIYLTNCAACHGLPMKDPNAIAKGMYPPPPQLFSPDQAAVGYPVGGLYWVVKNGIRLTGMPGFGDTLTEEQIWQVTHLVHSADKLPPSVLEALNESTAVAQPPVLPPDAID